MASDKEILAAGWFFCPHNGVVPGPNRVCGAPCGSCKHKGKGALEAAEAVRWEPIESAPKDGTDVLLFCDGGIVDMGWYDDGWIRFDGTRDPTHWQSLPSPPESKSK